MLRVSSLLFCLFLLCPANEVQAQRAPGDTLTDSVRALVRQIGREGWRVGRDIQNSQRSRSAISSEDLESAFKDSLARLVLERARIARMSQDSALSSYRARATQRFSASAGIRKLGLEKLLFRSDDVARIEWSRDGGIWITPEGSRTIVPMSGKSPIRNGQASNISIPYFPGKETLWMPNSESALVREDIDENEMIHPLARGAEAHYVYSSGESMTISLGDGSSIHLRELRIVARRSHWRLFVGSFWFDELSGQLVRAAYRLSVPLEIWDVVKESSVRDSALDMVVAKVTDSIAEERLSPSDYQLYREQRPALSSLADDDVPAWVRMAINPMRVSLDAITVEYGLFGGKFWLPRANSATFYAQVGPARMPFSFDEKFEYEDVNGDFETLPVPSADSLISARRVASISDSSTESESGRSRNCQLGDSTWLRVESRFGEKVRVAYRMPCDLSVLANSPVLPSVSASTEEIFDKSAQQQLMDALGLSLQPLWGVQRPVVRTGFDLVRYNRVEGLSVGIQAKQALGSGYVVGVSGRVGHADRHVNAEAGFERIAGNRSVYANVYKRLRSTAAPEWGDPLSFGASIPAVLYARDEGFYFRSTGIEIGDRKLKQDRAFEWRLFYERHATAGDSSVTNTWSLAKLFGSRSFRNNFTASHISTTGLEASYSRVFGQDPAGLITSSVVRMEGATGTVSYGRATLDLNMVRPLGPIAASVTARAGSSVGDLPPQRAWFLGGLRTVRGNIPGSAYGNAHWMVRTEAGTRSGWVRPVVFHDWGWAGDRSAFGEGRILRGAGGGISFLNGIFRFDIARNLAKGGGWRTDMYLEAPI